VGRLDGKVAVITGSGRGIGRATAELFAKEGAAVVVNDVDPEPAEEAGQAIKDAGGEVMVSTDNTVNLDEARRMMEAAANQFGKIDIVVNNAGITRDKTFHNMDDELWNFVLDINLKTAFHTSMAAMPYLREPAKKEKQEQGRPAYHRKVNFTTSTAFLQGNAGQANYTAAKGAIVGLMRTLARELGPLPHQLQCGGSRIHRDTPDGLEAGGIGHGRPRGHPPDGPDGYRARLLRAAGGRGEGPPLLGR